MLPLRKEYSQRAQLTTENLPLVFPHSALKGALHRALHESKAGAGEIAWSLRCGVNHLYRACLTGPSGRFFPIEWFAFFTRLTKDFRPIQVLCAECGGFFVRSARVRQLKKTPSDAVNQLSVHFHALLAKLLRFFERPDAAAAKEIDGEMIELLCELASLRQAVGTYQQMDLEVC